MLNKVIMVGRLTADPTYNEIGDKQTHCTNFTIAVNNYGKDSEPTFLNCVAYNKLADNINLYCRKGSQVAIDGALVQRSYTARDGSKRCVYEARLNSVEFLGGVQDDKEEDTLPLEEEPTSDPVDLDAIEIPDDDLPF